MLEVRKCNFYKAFATYYSFQLGKCLSLLLKLNILYCAVRARQREGARCLKIFLLQYYLCINILILLTKGYLKETVALELRQLILYEALFKQDCQYFFQFIYMGLLSNFRSEKCQNRGIAVMPSSNRKLCVLLNLLVRT